MIDQMLQLGDEKIVFGVSTATYQTITRTAEYRWADVDRLGRWPTSQFTGPGAETIAFEGVIYPELTLNPDAIARYREVAAEGRPMILTDGRGRKHGKWVITSITETAGQFFEKGVPRRIAFSMSIKRYGE